MGPWVAVQPAELAEGMLSLTEIRNQLGILLSGWLAPGENGFRCLSNYHGSASGLRWWGF